MSDYSEYSSIVSGVTVSEPPYDARNINYMARMRNRFGEPIKAGKMMSANWILSTNGETGLANVVLDADFSEHPAIQCGDILEIYASQDKKKTVDLYNDLRFRGRISNKRVQYGMNQNITIQALDFTSELSNKFIDWQYWNTDPQSIIHHMMDTMNMGGYVSYLKGGHGNNLLLNGGFENYHYSMDAGDPTDPTYSSWVPYNMAVGSSITSLYTSTKMYLYPFRTSPRSGLEDCRIVVSEINSGEDYCYLYQDVSNLTSGDIYNFEFYGKIDTARKFEPGVGFGRPYERGHLLGIIDRYSGGEIDNSLESPKVTTYHADYELKELKFQMHDNDKVRVKLQAGGTPDSATIFDIDDVQLYNYSFSGQHESVSNGSSIDWFDTTFDWLSLTNETLSSALNKIAKRLNAIWWVDSNMKLWFINPSSQVDKVYYDQNIESLILEEDSTNIKNKGLLVGGETAEYFAHSSGNLTSYWSGITPDYPSGIDSSSMFLEIAQTDFNTTHPLNLYDNAQWTGHYEQHWAAQTFQWTVSGLDISQVSFWGSLTQGYPVDPGRTHLELSICNLSGDSEKVPDDTDRIAVSTLSGIPDLYEGTQELIFPFNKNVDLISGESYALVLKMLMIVDPAHGNTSNTGMFNINGILNDNYYSGIAYTRYLHSDGDQDWVKHNTWSSDNDKIEDLKFTIYTGYKLIIPPYFIRRRKLREGFQDEFSMNNYGESQYQIRDESVLTPYYAKLLLFYENDKYGMAQKKGEINLAEGDFNIKLGDLVDVRKVIGRQYNPGTLNTSSGIYNMDNRSWEYNTLYDDKIISFDCLRLNYNLTEREGLKTQIMINNKRPLWEDMTKDLIDRIKNNEIPIDSNEFWEYIFEKVERPNDTRIYKADWNIQIKHYDGSDNLLREEHF